MQDHLGGFKTKPSQIRRALEYSSQNNNKSKIRILLAAVSEPPPPAIATVVALASTCGAIRLMARTVRPKIDDQMRTGTKKRN